MARIPVVPELTPVGTLHVDPRRRLKAQIPAISRKLAERVNSTMNEASRQLRVRAESVAKRKFRLHRP